MFWIVDQKRIAKVSFINGEFSGEPGRIVSIFHCFEKLAQVLLNFSAEAIINHPFMTVNKLEVFYVG